MSGGSVPAGLRRLFVYGTLKRGYCRHGALAKGRFLGTARTAEAYRLVNLGSYPGLVPAEENGVTIEGEIWEVDLTMLQVLDDIEGVDEGLYARRPVVLQQSEGGEVETYIYLGSVAGLADCGDRWE